MILTRTQAETKLAGQEGGGKRENPSHCFASLCGIHRSRHRNFRSARYDTEPVGVVMRAVNPSASEPLEVVIVQVSDPSKPFLDPANP